jgi:hypothetical protein
VVGQQIKNVGGEMRVTNSSGWNTGSYDMAYNAPVSAARSDTRNPMSLRSPTLSTMSMSISVLAPIIGSCLLLASSDL